MDNQRSLIVDDDPRILDVFKEILNPATEHGVKELARLLGDSPDQECQYDLSFARQGRDAFEMVGEGVDNGRPFATAFIDIRMPPGWDGVETAKQIRSIDRNIELVLVTAYADRTIEEITETIGAPEKLLFLRKPFDPGEITQFATSLTARWNIEREKRDRILELKLAADRFQAIAAISQDFFWEVDDRFRFTFCSANSLSLVGFLPEELLGVSYFDILAPEERARFKTIIERCSRAQVNFQNLRFFGLTKDGRQICIDSSGLPVLNDGYVVGFRGLARDITGQYSAEVELRKANYHFDSKYLFRTE